jgi:membrane fusion protein (multidrug efflux system)
MIKKLVLGIVLVVLVAGTLVTVKVMQIKTLIGAAALFAPPPESVSSAVAHTEQWQETVPAVGSVSAAQGVTVSPEIAGMVSEIDFESGATVQKGDLLVKLDTSSEEAQLRALEAQAKLARLNAERNRQLRADKTVSQSEVDASEAALEQAEGNADNLRAIIAKKHIRAPFSGKLGIRLVNLGESLNPGQGIVSLQALAPVYVDFSLPEQELARLQTGLTVRASSDAYPGQTFEGTLTAINPDLDTVTRSLRVRAAFANTNELLRPGMFVRAAVELPGAQTVLVIPSTAVLSAAYGDSVYVINGTTNLVVEQKLIRTGRSRGDFVTVEEGLKPGDKVVTAGGFKLRNGMSVTENNRMVPPTSTTPNPPNS